jgi:hypothetical protein
MSRAPGDQLNVTARDRGDSAGIRAKSNRRYMRSGRTNSRNAHGGFGAFVKENIIKRDNAVGQIGPEGADMTDRKQFDRALHGNFERADLSDA